LVKFWYKTKFLYLKEYKFSKWILNSNKILFFYPPTLLFLSKYYQSIMENQLHYEENLKDAISWITQGETRDNIRKRLLDKGLEDCVLCNVMNAVSVFYYAKRRERGVGLLIAGSILLVSGFFLTVFLFHANASIDMAMYGLTGTGILVLLYGLIEVLGW